MFVSHMGTHVCNNTHGHVDYMIIRVIGFSSFALQSEFFPSLSADLDVCYCMLSLYVNLRRGAELEANVSLGSRSFSDLFLNT